MEEVQTPCVVSLTWRLEDAQSELIDTLDTPTEFLVGGEDLLPKVEQALLGQLTGAEIGVALEPTDAFGEYDADLVCFEARSLFPAEVDVGMRFEGLPPGAQSEDMPMEAIYTVTEVYPEHVVLDGNHPLAGIGLRLHLKVCGVREATEEELEAKSVGGSFVQVLEGAPADEPLH
ncbi:FKBP-type peptidyl-prolyl cis-trans isomerase [Inhella gelatinilytica]|uniref:peptidylprolyl isomerase n=1 Tax=Inhella gelatinilytica TaxID=2795030 RepID=A0A931NFI2_9BURK|nr:peptidylprolyl isomerase [Inhella gelatinilytica]MBH9554270.1 peptidylprolyl isomerase [Inhella gelatinilytica]